MMEREHTSGSRSENIQSKKKRRSSTEISQRWCLESSTIKIDDGSKITESSPPLELSSAEFDPLHLLP